MYEKEKAAIVDVSQNPGRTRIVEEDDMCTRAILPNSTMMMVGKKLPCRPLLGREALTLQGFMWQQQPEKMASYSDAFLMDLSGNAFAGNVVLAVMLSSFMAMPWARDSEATLTSRDHAGAANTAMASQAESSSSSTVDSSDMQEVLSFLGVQ